MSDKFCIKMCVKCVKILLQILNIFLNIHCCTHEKVTNFNFKMQKRETQKTERYLKYSVWEGYPMRWFYNAAFEVRTRNSAIVYLCN